MAALGAGCSGSAPAPGALRNGLDLRDSGRAAIEQEMALLPQIVADR